MSLLFVLLDNIYGSFIYLLLLPCILTSLQSREKPCCGTHQIIYFYYESCSEGRIEPLPYLTIKKGIIILKSADLLWICIILMGDQIDVLMNLLHITTKPNQFEPDCRNISSYTLMSRPAARLETIVLVKQTYVLV